MVYPKGIGELDAGQPTKSENPLTRRWESSKGEEDLREEQTFRRLDLT